MHRFEDTRYYRPADPEMRLIGTEGSLAQMRHNGTGPPYHRVSNRILYLGGELNAYIDERKVMPVKRAA